MNVNPHVYAIVFTVAIFATCIDLILSVIIRDDWRIYLALIPFSMWFYHVVYLCVKDEY